MKSAPTESQPLSLRHGFAVFTPEPELGELEPAYRKATLRSDADQIRILIVIYSLFVLIYGVLDFLLFGFSRQVLLLYSVRLLMLATSVFMIVYLGRATSPKKTDRLLLAWALVTVNCVLCINSSRTGTFFYTTAVDLVIVIAFHTAVPNRFWFRLLPAVWLSLGDLGLIANLGAEMNFNGAISTVMTLVVGNLVGVITSTRLYTYRRRQFLFQHQEQIARREIEVLATTDGLTQMANRRFFMETARRQFDQYRRYHRPFSFLLLDLDFFKRVNDTHGHAVGDQVLDRFAQLTKGIIRRTDFVGRVGGEEFAVLLTETPLAGARIAAERIRDACANMIVTAGACDIAITVSIGITTATENDASLETLYERADRALYRAKEAGRNRAEVLAAGDLPAMA